MSSGGWLALALGALAWAMKATPKCPAALSDSQHIGVGVVVIRTRFARVEKADRPVDLTLQLQELGDAPARSSVLVVVASMITRVFCPRPELPVSFFFLEHLTMSTCSH